MIEFSFTLSDADAENLFDCIRSAQARSMTYASKAVAAGNKELEASYNTDVEYLEALRLKLTHKRIN